MSLHLYFADEPLPTDMELVFDVESAFFKNDWYMTPALEKVIYDIEGAKPSPTNPSAFIDRFGQSLYWEFLSTGSKTAILVANTSKSFKQCINASNFPYFFVSFSH